jgi:hypothetical protein
MFGIRVGIIGQRLVAGFRFGKEKENGSNVYIEKSLFPGLEGGVRKLRGGGF